MHRYDFTDNPVSNLYEVVTSMLPGIEKVVTVFFDTASKSLIGKSAEKEKGSYKIKELDISRASESLFQIRKNKTPFTWFNRESVPFEVYDKTLLPELDIFDEKDNVILLIKLPGEQKGLSDLVFIYFNENPSNFGVSNSDSPLTTESKSAIAFLIHNTLKMIVESKRNNRKVLLFNNERTRKIISQTEKLSAELQRTHDNYGLSLVKLCTQYLKEHGRKNGRNYIFSQDALDKISGFTGELKDLEQIISDAVEYVNNLYIDTSGEIRITKWHIDFNIDKTYTKSVPQDKSSTDKYSKTVSLLNKLEQAALIVRKQNLKMTGTNVGHYCEKPVSAPAISDSLYNHRNKITTLLEKYPDKWETIRAEFRPLKNIIEKSGGQP